MECIGFRYGKPGTVINGDKLGNPYPDPTADDHWDRRGGSGGGGDGDGDGKDGKSGDGSDPKFKNITDKDLVEMLDSLRKDCMGQVLLDKLHSTITFRTGPDALLPWGVAGEYGQTTIGGICVSERIGLRSAQYMSTIIHEMTHAYQYEAHNTDDYMSWNINREVEVRVGVYLYYDRNNIPKDNLINSFGGTEGMLAFSFLADLYSFDISSGDIFKKAYDDAVNILCTRYKSYSKGNVSDSHKNFDILKELMKDC